MPGLVEGSLEASEKGVNWGVEGARRVAARRARAVRRRLGMVLSARMKCAGLGLGAGRMVERRMRLGRREDDGKASVSIALT